MITFPVNSKSNLSQDKLKYIFWNSFLFFFKVGFYHAWVLAWLHLWWAFDKKKQEDKRRDTKKVNNL